MHKYNIQVGSAIVPQLAEQQNNSRSGSSRVSFQRVSFWNQISSTTGGRPVKSDSNRSQIRSGHRRAATGYCTPDYCTVIGVSGSQETCDSPHQYRPELSWNRLLAQYHRFPALLRNHTSKRCHSVTAVPSSAVVGVWRFVRTASYVLV